MDVLCASDFVLRTGIRSIVYVHWTCVKSWLVQSYNLKRLQRESIPIESLTSGVLKAPTYLSEPDVRSESAGCSRTKRRREADVDSEVLEGPSLKRSREDYGTSESISDFVDRETIFMIPQPWIRVNGTLNRRALDKWMGSILLHVIQLPNMYFRELCNRFNVLTPFQIRRLLESLVELKCLELLTQHSSKKTDLFMDEEVFEVTTATDFHCQDWIFIKPMSDALTKYSIFIGNKKYASDFI